MEYNDILIDIKDHIRILTINKPKAMNACSILTNLEMQDALDEFSANDDEWVCIITGAGDRAFSAGNDLKFQATTPPDELKRLVAKMTKGMGGIADREDCFKPVIAAVNGLALGGGFEVVLACDIVIAAENAIFGFPEPKVGMIAFGGGVHRIARYIPYHKAMGLLLSGEPVSAEEGKTLGFVNDVVPADQLMDKVMELAKKITKLAPLSVQSTKQAVLMGQRMSIIEATKATYGFPIVQKMLNSEDAIEGPKAFVEKRAPQWKGQ